MRSNLCEAFDAADPVDRNEGRMAYQRYRDVLQEIADAYGLELGQVIAGFVALSPNSSYFVNLRSLVSVAHGIRRGIAPKHITVATYGHCRDRAYAYMTGKVDFLSTVKGPKIASFYKNIDTPEDPWPVTVDGHLVAAWRGQNLTMKEAKCSRREYIEIADETRYLAQQKGLIGNQMQATIWFSRKRRQGIIYDPQGDLLYGKDDMWRTRVRLRDLRPYADRPA